MSSFTKTADRLDNIVEVMGRAVTAAFFAVVTVGLVCLIALIIAGTYAILHPGNDFGDVGGGGGGGGDVIVLHGMLP